MDDLVVECEHGVTFRQSELARLFEGGCPSCEVAAERADGFARCPCCQVEWAISGEVLVFRIPIGRLLVTAGQSQEGKT